MFILLYLILTYYNIIYTHNIIVQIQIWLTFSILFNKYDM